MSASSRSVPASSKRPSQSSMNNPTKRRNTTQSVFHSVPPHGSSLVPGRLGQSDREENDERLDHIIMAIDKTMKGTIGCAYYIAQEEVLCCVQDIESGYSEAIEILKLDIQPTLLIISPRIVDTDNGLQAQRQNSLSSEDETHRPLPYELVTRPSADFKYENALNKLAALQDQISNHDGLRFLVPGDDTDYDEFRPVDEVGLTNRVGKLLHVSGRLDLDSRLSIGCAGAVMAHLQRKRASEYLQDDPEIESAYAISHLEVVSLKNSMLVNADTLASLQIVQPESHPNAAKQGPGSSGAKESLSVYGLFCHLARSPQGKSKLRQLFLRPSLDLDEILRRQRFVSICSSSKNQLASEELSKGLTRVTNMRRVVTNLRKGIENGSGGKIKSGVWSAILEFCYNAIDIAQTLSEIEGAENLALCVRANECLDIAQLQRLGKMVHDIIDLDESCEQHRTVIKRGVNEHLDQVKDVYDSMDDRLSQIATKIYTSIPQDVNVSLVVSFIPQLGFHIVIPLSDKLPVYSQEGWDRVFITETQAYFKDTTMKDLDQQLGDLYAVICDTEIEISHDLAQRVLQHEKLLKTASDLCGELDCLLALVHGTIQFNLVRPKVIEGNVIDIKGGRHILQEMTVPPFVPNDTLLNQETSMVMLTGPNYSGKSVYMKQIALIVYMAQVGCFVPADSATIGIVDKILTRVTTRETVSKVQSAFMIDLQQVTWALDAHTPKSLIIIDEFGKGTDPCDGAGLACAVFEYLLSVQEPPKVLASTHFHEIFESGRFEKYRNINFQHMEIHVNSKQKQKLGQDASEVSYLYNLRPGRSMLSYGTQCAVLNGIPELVTQRATHLSELAVRGGDLVAACSALPEAEFEELEVAEMMAREFLSQDLEGDLRAMLDGISSFP